jgi:hypothetical protein
MRSEAFGLQDAEYMLRLRTGSVKQGSNTFSAFSTSPLSLRTIRDYDQNTKLITFWCPAIHTLFPYEVLFLTMMLGPKKQTTARWLQTSRFRGFLVLIAPAGNDVSAERKWLILTAPIVERSLSTRRGCPDVGGLSPPYPSSQFNNFMTVFFAYTLILSK